MGFDCINARPLPFYLLFLGQIHYSHFVLLSLFAEAIIIPESSCAKFRNPFSRSTIPGLNRFLLSAKCIHIHCFHHQYSFFIFA